jgi:hypothetical protein
MQDRVETAELSLGSDHADPNCLALAFWILQPCLLGLFLCRERFRQRSEFTTDVLEEQPSLNNSGHLKFIAQAALTCG